jgi:hypothetical protein
LGFELFLLIIIAVMLLVAMWMSDSKGFRTAEDKNTFVLFLTLGVLAATCWAIVQQVGEMQKAYPEIRKQADAAKLQSEAAKLQADAAKTSIEIAHQNFMMDMRPFVAVSDIANERLVAKTGDKVRWDIQYINYGKSPTKKGVVTAHVWFGEKALASASQFFEQLSSAPPSQWLDFLIPPNANAKPNDNGFTFISILSDTEFADPDKSFVATHDRGIVLAGRFWYTDVFDEPHHTDFCRFTLVTGAIANCGLYNSMQ